MVRLFVYSIKLLLVSVAIGVLGTHYLMSPISSEVKSAAITIIILSLGIEIYRSQVKK